jgi:N-acetylglucosamine kinase-like BadF-type ATPase
LNGENGELIALEGGGTRCRAVWMNRAGAVLAAHQAGSVNTNFIPLEEARHAVRQAIQGVLAQIKHSDPGQVKLLVISLVGPRFGAETFADLLPQAKYLYFDERDIIFARAGLYRPHGVAVVGATGATAWAIRQDDGRQVAFGGWGALLGDEGSAYAMGLMALRQAGRAWEGRLEVPTQLPQTLCEYYGFRLETFKPELVRLAYGKPLNRSDIAGLAPLVTRLASQGDPAAQVIVSKVASDLANLAIHTANRLFSYPETFDLAAGGGLLNAGEMVIAPLRQLLNQRFPQAVLRLADQDPAEALGRLALARTGEQRDSSGS